MPHPDDKPLHDRVRQLLDAHQPAYDPQDWLVLRRRLRRRRWRTGLLAGSLLLLLGGVGWYVTPAFLGGKSTVATATKLPHRAGKSTLSLAKQRVIVPAISGREATLLTVNQPINTKNCSVKLRPSITPTSSVPRLVSPQDAPAPDPAVASLLPIQQVRLPERPWPVVAFRTMTRQETDLEQKLLSGKIDTDSTVFTALTRNLRRWPNAVVVCDLTTSMDPFAAQVYAWFRRNAKSPQIQGTVFYTDCDSLGQETRPGGPAGNFFVTRERDPRRALPTLLAAARNTIGNKTDPENVVEALRFAQKTFPTAKHLILIADNGSGVKDLHLLPGLILPVHVIACNTQAGSDYAFEPGQFQIARQTNGSVHTLDDDLVPGKVANNTFVRVGPTYFRYSSRKGRFVKTDFKRRPVRVLGVNL